MAFAAVIFDYDGTLFDTRPAIMQCLERAFAECGRPVPARASIAETVKAGLTLSDTFLTLDVRLRHDRVSLDELVRTYRRSYLDTGATLVEPYVGVRPALQELHDGGEICIVVSNKGIVAVRRSFEQYDLAPLVDLIFADEPGLPKKPDPAIIVDHVLPRYPQLFREQILMVGDTETDILFAKRTGMASCWVSYGYGEAARCRKLSPDFEIASLSELPALALAQ